jgi:hypothetical protein
VCVLIKIQIDSSSTANPVLIVYTEPPRRVYYLQTHTARLRKQNGFCQEDLLIFDLRAHHCHLSPTSPLCKHVPVHARVRVHRKWVMGYAAADVQGSRRCDNRYQPGRYYVSELRRFTFSRLFPGEGRPIDERFPLAYFHSELTPVL